MNGGEQRAIRRAPHKEDRAIERDGFAIVRNVIEASEIRALIEILGPVKNAGRRGLLSVPAVQKLARSEKLLGLVGPHFTSEPTPVKAIYFDKTPSTNWSVPWHQDLTLAVRASHDVPGFGPWSNKQGVPHVQPPIEFLERMLTVRLHLDDCDESTGALWIIPGTHCLGRLNAEGIFELRKAKSEVVCRVRAGDALLMRPLLLHASGRSQLNQHRRVLHVEYSDFSLPPPLDWEEAPRHSSTSED